MRCLLYCWLPFLFIVRNGELKKYTITGFAQGTTYSITYYATDSIVIKRQVDSILDIIDSSLSLYKPYSIINQFNHFRTGRKIDNYIVNVIKKSILVYHEINGLFDVTVKRLVQAWCLGLTISDLLPGKT